MLCMYVVDLMCLPQRLTNIISVARECIVGGYDRGVTVLYCVNRN